MQEQYRPDLLEPEVQKFWQDNKTFKAVQDNNKEKDLEVFEADSNKEVIKNEDPANKKEETEWRKSKLEKKIT